MVDLTDENLLLDDDLSSFANDAIPQNVEASAIKHCSDEEQESLEKDVGHPQDIRLKQQCDEEDTGASNRQSSRKRDTVDRYSGQPESGTKKKQRKSNTKKCFIRPEAVGTIQKLDEPLFSCHILLDELWDMAALPGERHKIDEIRTKIETMENIKSELIDFSKKNKK